MEEIRENKKGFKKTEIGYIPKDWKVAKVKDMYELNSNQITSSNTPFDEFYYIDLSSVKSGVVTVPNEKIKLDEAPSRAKRILEQNDVIISTVRPNLKGFAIADFKVDSMVCSTGFALIKSKDVLDGKYLLHNLFSHSISNQIENLVVGSNYPAINTSDVLNLIIPCPPLPEQQKIATILSKWDELIETQTKLIEEKEKQKKGLMQKLLTGEIRLPGFEEEWGIGVVKEYTDIKTGNSDTQDKVEDGKYPFFVRSQTIERINSFSFDGEAVLTSGDGVGVGKIYHYLNEKFDYHQRVYNIHNFNSKLDGKFFYYYFSEHFYKRVMAMSAKGSVDSVRMEMIADMKFPLPPVNEQLKIVNILSSCDEEIQSLKDLLEAIKLQKKGLMQQLLTGKIRVKV